ncbi:DoxX family membrane protein [Actinomadura sp. GC306]|uniref:DoxX family membrane protein n=1 Tax=Actinomadura sp. GC306 TaxID=2530367 RepID=UPI00104D0708|nr:DoxX family membrane protein [Actinomadura sp. GC306]TDC64313.1 DoxX family membrane protein [Actinomadura sp. GC306]
MRPFTTLARPFVAAPYIMTGLEAVREPRERAEQVGPALKPVADRIEWLPKDPETLVRMEGALSLGTGALLLTGKFRRLTTLLLAAQLVPALATEHRFWTEDDPERRANERSHLLKNAGLFGALLMAATEPRRPPRTAELRRIARETQIKGGAEAKALRREAAATLRDARREAAHQVRTARAASGRKAAKKGAKQTAKAAKVAKAAKSAAPAKSVTVKIAKPGGLTGKGRKRGGPLQSLKAGGARAGAAFKLGRASKPGRAARAGQTVKAGTATQAAKAVKAGKNVKAGTAAQAGRVKQAVRS